MLRAIRSVALAAVLAGFAGCTASPEGGQPSFGEKLAAYPGDRLVDLLDVAGLDLYYGQGVIAHAQATKIAQLGFGTFDGDIFKSHRRSLGVVEEVRSEAGLPFYYFTCYDRRAISGNPAFLAAHEELTGLGEVHYSITDNNDRGFYELGATLGVFVGLGVSVDLFQAVDFFAGFFMIDIGRDDKFSGRPPVENPRAKGPGALPLTEDGIGG